MVLGQRQIKLAAELPDRPPAGFGELRNEILGFAVEEEQGLLKVRGMQPDEEGDDPASLLFVVVTDDREYPYHEPFMREVSFLFLFNISACSVHHFSSCSLLRYSIYEKLLTI
jgi:hypothetical protein